MRPRQIRVPCGALPSPKAPRIQIILDSNNTTGQLCQTKNAFIFTIFLAEMSYLQPRDRLIHGVSLKLLSILKFQNISHFFFFLSAKFRDIMDYFLYLPVSRQ
jgi:hypothetical protein